MVGKWEPVLIQKFLFPSQVLSMHSYTHSLLMPKKQYWIYSMPQSVTRVIWLPNKLLLWASSIYWIKNILQNQCNLIAEQMRRFFLLNQKHTAYSHLKIFPKNKILWFSKRQLMELNALRNVWQRPKRSQGESHQVITPRLKVVPKGLIL